MQVKRIRDALSEEYTRVIKNLGAQRHRKYKQNAETTNRSRHNVFHIECGRDACASERVLAASPTAHT